MNAERYIKYCNPMGDVPTFIRGTVATIAHILMQGLANLGEMSRHQLSQSLIVSRGMRFAGSNLS